MGTWILRLDEGAAGPRWALKDLLDWAGTPTTAGSAAVAREAAPAGTDAACLAGLRAAVAAGRARVVGKANLHELADGITGINPWFGTPTNPLDPALVPGGSSSGSAAAVGAGEADLAVGTDTGGSVRIPAACCGVAGLTTTWGRLPVAGLWPLAPSLDTVGPLARDVAGLVAAMEVLDAGFDAAAARRPWVPGRLGRLHPDLPVDPAIDAAVDAAAAATGARVVDVGVPGWGQAVRDGLAVLGAESAALHAHRAGEAGADVAANLAHAARVGRQRERDARSGGRRWAATLGACLDTVDALVLPTLGAAPPPVGPAAAAAMTVAWTLPINLAGLPAVALPVPRAGGGLPASVQVVGRAGAEEGLLAIAAALAAAAPL